MSRVKRTWLQREPPVWLDFLLTKGRGAVVLCGCPQCGKAHETTGLTDTRNVQCSCGAFLRQTITVTLEELEEEEGNGE
ncbi:MAG: hypothetical protein KAX80_07725 [Planctomycetes bacterium]|nr:hypothetical protein [Planctomycetota bacterium]